MRKVGDIIRFEATGELAPYIECEVLEVSPDDGRITKMKAVTPDDRLFKSGFILEGDDWVAVEWDYYEN
jgi:hypothetical protein